MNSRISSIKQLFRAVVLGMVIAGATLAFTTTALADKIHLKDGRILEGKIVREGADFVIFKIKVGSIEQDKVFDAKEVVKIERDDPAPKTDEAEKAKADAAAASDKKPEAAKHTGATRVAILNFGPPSDWQSKTGDMVGVQVSSKAFKDVVPMLEKAKVEVVVVRINSGGGYTLELGRFHEIFETYYKPKFRTVAWVESAISCAAMSPWVLNEFYFLPNGNIGGCTEWSGNQNASKGMKLEMILATMEQASDRAGRDRKIMRAMQIMDPLSYDIDESGNIVWRDDELGQHVLNRAKRVYTMNAQDAVRSRFGKGIAATKEELAKAMGLQEVEWVALDASEYIDNNIVENDRVEKRTGEVYEKYTLHIGLADRMQDKKMRGAELARAKRYLAELRNMVKVNPNFEFHLGIPPEWFAAQDELIKKIAERP
jgi:hypothetical protein